MTPMIHPVIQRVTPDIDFDSSRRQNLHDVTFADHFDRQLEQKRIQGKDTFGVQTSKKSDSDDVARNLVGQEDHVEKAKDVFSFLIPSITVNPEQQIQQGPEISRQSVANVLGQFMDDLQKTATQKDIAPGEWVAVLPDPSALHKLAAAAGMAESEMSLLQQQMAAQGGELNLPEFLGVLEQHFTTMQDVPEITVPETELPLLETLLAKMGFNSEELAEITQHAVKSEGKLDLILLLEGLQQITPGGELENIQLTDWELEQLQNILAQAGVRQSLQTALFPERYLENIFGEDRKGFDLSFERLQDMLAKAITDVSQNRPQPQFTAFLKELEQVLSQTKFSDESVGWTPVIQQSLTAVFREMQDAVELAGKRFTEEMILEGSTGIEEDQPVFQRAMTAGQVESVVEDFYVNKSLDDHFYPIGQTVPFNVSSKRFNDEMFAENRGIDEELQAMQPLLFEGKTISVAEYFSRSSFESLTNRQNPIPSRNDAGTAFSTFPLASDVLPGTLEIASAQESHTIPRTPQQLQLQVSQQISAAVMHGIRNQEHHLVLRLYPQELGEVKVDMIVKDDQISITFNMENSRVKEMLESNMEQFRQNMEQKGFSLGECNVSVGQQDDFDNEWRRFMMSGSTMRHQGEASGELSDDVYYLRGNMHENGGREGALNLFV